MKKIAFLCYENFQILDLTGPMEVFHQLNRAKPKDVYSLKVLSEHGGMVEASNGLQVNTRKLGSLKGFHALVVVGGRGITAAVENKRLIRYIEKQSENVELSVSICSGSLALAKAGLLANKKATSHWSFIERLKEIDPSTLVFEDAIFVEDENVMSSAGVTAGLDLALALVERDSDRQTAMSIARNLVMTYRREGGQSQYSEKLQAQECSNPAFSELCLYIQENLHHDLRVETLAARCAMSNRNFSRKFTSLMQCSPGQYVEKLRIEHAKEILSVETESLKRVADRCGYDNLDVFRRAFKRAAGVSAAEFQKRFGPTQKLRA